MSDHRTEAREPETGRYEADREAARDILGHSTTIDEPEVRIALAAQAIAYALLDVADTMRKIVVHLERAERRHQET